MGNGKWEMEMEEEEVKEEEKPVKPSGKKSKGRKFKTEDYDRFLESGESDWP